MMSSLANCFAFLFARLSQRPIVRDTLMLQVSLAIFSERSRYVAEMPESSAREKNGKETVIRQLATPEAAVPATALEPSPNVLATSRDNGSENASKITRKRHTARPLRLPRDRLAIVFQRCREESGLSFSQLADRSGVDVAHIWRIEQGEHQNVSREVLILLSIALVLGSQSVDLVVDVANEILDAAGLKMLRAPHDASFPRIRDPHGGKNCHDS